MRFSAISCGRPQDVLFVKFTEPFAPTELREVSFVSGGEWVVLNVT